MRFMTCLFGAMIVVTVIALLLLLNINTFHPAAHLP